MALLPEKEAAVAAYTNATMTNLTLRLPFD